MGAPFLNLRFTRWMGALLFLAALPLFLQFLVRFVAEGRGTPAPVAPPERLVVGGPFRWVRNPGYIAVLGPRRLGRCRQGHCNDSQAGLTRT